MSFYGQQVVSQPIDWPEDDLLWTQVKVGNDTYTLTGSNSLGFLGDESIGLSAVSKEGGVKEITFQLENGAIQTQKLKQQKVYDTTSTEKNLYDILTDVLQKNGDLKNPSEYKYITVTATTGEGEQTQFKRQCIFVYTPNQVYLNTHWSLLADIRAPEYNSTNETLTLY